MLARSLVYKQNSYKNRALINNLIVFLIVILWYMITHRFLTEPWLFYMGHPSPVWLLALVKVIRKGSNRDPVYRYSIRELTFDSRGGGGGGGGGNLIDNKYIYIEVNDITVDWWVNWLRPWWRHQMETFSALLAICGGTHRSTVNSTHKGQWRGALMFSLICVWINRWVNNREAGDLRR